MKIKKKELRKREAQLPINYPHPDVEEEINKINDNFFNAEKTRVEFLCKQLAHNEVVVRDAVLDKLPQFIQHVTKELKIIEEKKEGKKEETDFAALISTFIKMRNKRQNGGVIINVLEELDAHREKEEKFKREEKRQAALRSLRQEQTKEIKEETDWANNNNNNNADMMFSKVNCVNNKINLRCVYRKWLFAWSEVELILLKLSRGLFFCLWHADKPLVQLKCAERIAKLIYAPHTNSGKILLFSCLMRVLQREWRTMDKYRSDKFLAFVRKLIYNLISLLKSLEEETRVNQRNGVNNTFITNNDNKEDDNNDDDDYILEVNPLCRALNEACYVFRAQIIAEPTAVGLSMHICDVFFDELCRAQLSPVLFIALSDRVALYAMSQGNFVEKRVLDYFISPIASGVLATRRRSSFSFACSYNQQEEEEEKEDDEFSKNISLLSPQNKKKRKRSTNNNNSNNNNNNEGSVKTDKETNMIIRKLADCCRRYSIARGTVRQVRVMFTEGELALRQAINLDVCKEVTRGELRRCIEREVEEVEETRHAVVEERRNLRLLRREDKKE